MPFSFSVSGSSEEEDVFAFGCKLCELIEGEASSFGGSDSISDGLREFKCDNSESLRNVKESDIVGDWPYDGDDSFEFVVPLCLG